MKALSGCTPSRLSLRVRCSICHFSDLLHQDAITRARDLFLRFMCFSRSATIDAGSKFSLHPAGFLSFASHPCISLASVSSAP